MDAGLNPIWRLLPRLRQAALFHLQKYNPVARFTAAAEIFTGPVCNCRLTELGPVTTRAMVNTILY